MLALSIKISFYYHSHLLYLKNKLHASPSNLYIVPGEIFTNIICIVLACSKKYTWKITHLRRWWFCSSFFSDFLWFISKELQGKGGQWFIKHILYLPRIFLHSFFNPSIQNIILSKCQSVWKTPLNYMWCQEEKCVCIRQQLGR